MYTEKYRVLRACVYNIGGKKTYLWLCARYQIHAEYSDIVPSLSFVLMKSGPWSLPPRQGPSPKALSFPF